MPIWILPPPPLVQGLLTLGALSDANQSDHVHFTRGTSTEPSVLLKPGTASSASSHCIVEVGLKVRSSHRCRGILLHFDDGAIIVVEDGAMPVMLRVEVMDDAKAMSVLVLDVKAMNFAVGEMITGDGTTTAVWRFAACHPCPDRSGVHLIEFTFWVRPDESPAATVVKRTAEVESRLQLATMSLWRLIGCGKDVATLLWHCAACHPCPYWSGAP